MPADYYTILGLSREATPEQIRRAYHKAASRLHPDVNIEPGATELFLHATKAYETLSDPVKRASYDAALLVESQEPDLIRLRTLFSRPAILYIGEPQLIYAILEFSSPPGLTSASPAATSSPLNVSLVIDRSTSMKGERMDTVKASAIELVRQLKPEDFLSIIVFNDRAEVLMPADRYANSRSVETSIRLIQPYGGTEILQGLMAGMSEVRRNLSKKHINHIVLLTDGRTYGDEQECQELADQAAELGIGITGLGIGSEWNDNFLDELATRTGGNSAYIAKPGDIKDFLREKFRDLGSVYAEQLKLELHTAPEVELNYVYRLRPDPMPIPLAPLLRLGSVPSGRRNLSVLLEFQIQPFPVGLTNSPLATGKLTFDVPSVTNSSTTIPLELKLSVTSEFQNGNPPREIIQAVSQITLYRMQEKARQEVNAGNIEKASDRLKNLANHLYSQGKQDLARTVLFEADHIINTHTFTEEGEKRIKYGTRGLLLPGENQGADT